MNIRRAAAVASIAALLPFAGAALAQDAPATGDSNAELRREIEDQKQRLLVLERKLEIQQEAATAAATTTPRDHGQRVALPDRFGRRRQLRAPARHAARGRARVRR